MTDRELLRWQVSDDRAAARVELVPDDPRPRQDDPARKATEWALPGLQCPCCGTVTFAEPPPGAHADSTSCWAVLNTAAVVLTGYGNVSPERAAQVMAILLGVPVSPGWVDKASARLAAQLGKAGFDAAMLVALAEEKALATDETPMNVLDTSTPQPAAREEEEEGDSEKTEKTAPGTAHAPIIRTPDGRLTWSATPVLDGAGGQARSVPAAAGGLAVELRETGRGDGLEPQRAYLRPDVPVDQVAVVLQGFGLDLYGVGFEPLTPASNRCGCMRLIVAGADDHEGAPRPPA